MPPANTPLPVVQAIVLCDHLYRDGPSGKCIIAGTFRKVSAPSYPATHTNSWLYACLLDCTKGDFVLRVVYLQDNSVVMESGAIPLKPQDRNQVQEIGVALPPLQLPRAGSYEIEVLWGAQKARLGAWRFEAITPTEQGS